MVLVKFVVPETVPEIEAPVAGVDCTESCTPDRSYSATAVVSSVIAKVTPVCPAGWPAPLTLQRLNSKTSPPLSTLERAVRLTDEPWATAAV